MTEVVPTHRTVWRHCYAWFWYTSGHHSLILTVARHACRVGLVGCSSVQAG